MVVLGVFPATRPENWCGEYKPSIALSSPEEEPTEERPRPALVGR
jgi:hypothetical protein